MGNNIKILLTSPLLYLSTLALALTGCNKTGNSMGMMPSEEQQKEKSTASGSNKHSVALDLNDSNSGSDPDRYFFHGTVNCGECKAKFKEMPRGNIVVDPGCNNPEPFDPIKSNIEFEASAAAITHGKHDAIIDQVMNRGNQLEVWMLVAKASAEGKAKVRLGDVAKKYSVDISENQI